MEKHDPNEVPKEYQELMKRVLCPVTDSDHFLANMFFGDAWCGEGTPQPKGIISPETKPPE